MLFRAAATPDIDALKIRCRHAAAALRDAYDKRERAMLMRY